MMCDITNTLNKFVQKRANSLIGTNLYIVRWPSLRWQYQYTVYQKDSTGVESLHFERHENRIQTNCCKSTVKGVLLLVHILEILGSKRASDVGASPKR